MKHITLFLIVITLFTSCATTNTFNNGPFQKRKYTKGFHIGSKKEIKVDNSSSSLIFNSEVSNGDNSIKVSNCKEIGSDIVPNNQEMIKNTADNKSTELNTLTSSKEVNHTEKEEINTVDQTIHKAKPRINKTVKKNEGAEKLKTPIVSIFSLFFTGISLALTITFVLTTSTSSLTLFVMLLLGLVFSGLLGFSLGIIGVIIARSDETKYDINKTNKISLISVCYVCLVFLAVIIA